jgi:phytoene dehydrogenase-like protein
VVVVGAGIGGLVSALLLACRGLGVTVVESARSPGGKMRQVQVDGAGIDSRADGVHDALGVRRDPRRSRHICSTRC